jgi:SynChlorMet cassette protein ScmC
MIQEYQVAKAIVGGYLLRLGNGEGWQLTSTADVRAEVEELARIMGLNSCEPNGYPKLIFIRRTLGNTEGEEPMRRLGENTQKDLRGLGWKARDLGLLRLWSHKDVPDLICEMKHEEGDYELSILRMQLSLYPIYQLAQDSGGLPFHAGLVERNGKGVMLTAPANTGKSTCCHRLPRPWRTLCDEETLVVRDVQKRYLAHPFPTWSDYHTKRSRRTWDVYRHLPLSSIFLLEQGDRDAAIPVGQGEAAVFMYQSAMQVCYRYWDSLDHEELSVRKRKLFENACDLAGTVPTFKLQVSLTGRFWEEIEKVSF